MNTPSNLVLFHNPHSRSCMTRALLDELGVDYELCIIDFRSDEQLSAEYLAINPMGKVPAIRHNGTLVTETVAIYIYLADAFRDAGLAPAMDEPDRGSYLRWLVFYAACFEPAINDLAMKREPGPRAHSPYADAATVLETIGAVIAKGPYVLGERFSAADVLWANAFRWVTGFGMIESTPAIDAYMQRVLSRPAQIKARNADGQLVQEMKLVA